MCPPPPVPQNESGFLQYLDISVGKEVAALCTRGGRLAVMAQNPATAIVHLGHSNGGRPPSFNPPNL